MQRTERQLTVTHMHALALSHVVGHCAYICAWANFPIWEPKTRFSAPHSGRDLDICSELGENKVKLDYLITFLPFYNAFPGFHSTFKYVLLLISILG